VDYTIHNRLGVKDPAYSVIFCSPKITFELKIT